MREDSRTLVFAASVCIVCSLLLSVTAAGLKGLQDANAAFDVQRNILKAFGEFKADMDKAELIAFYEKHVEKDENSELPLFTWTDEGQTTPSKYAFPIEGKGLWGDIFGYVALKSDLATIEGISFYKHKETPGLGAEIEKEWFTSQFNNKKLYKEGQATDFSIVKSGGDQSDTTVDGISGATLTGKSVGVFLRQDAAAYEAYFNRIRGN
jgi:Na+-transporting NADH:ubiquinone oxidoreductase subunit C